MRRLKTILFAVMMFFFLEGIIYLFVAFCVWDINWIPEAHWLGRAAYGVVALSAITGIANMSVEYYKELVD